MMSRLSCAPWSASCCRVACGAATLRWQGFLHFVTAFPTREASVSPLAICLPAIATVPILQVEGVCAAAPLRAAGDGAAAALRAAAVAPAATALVAAAAPVGGATATAVAPAAASSTATLVPATPFVPAVALKEGDEVIDVDGTWHLWRQTVTARRLLGGVMAPQQRCRRGNAEQGSRLSAATPMASMPRRLACALNGGNEATEAPRPEGGSGDGERRAPAPGTARVGRPRGGEVGAGAAAPAEVSRCRRRCGAPRRARQPTEPRREQTRKPPRSSIFSTSLGGPRYTNGQPTLTLNR